MKKQVNFWVHVGRTVKNKYNPALLKLLGKILVIFGPYVIVSFSPMWLDEIFGGHRNPLWILSYLFFIPCFFWMWYLLYKADPEYEEPTNESHPTGEKKP